MKNKIKDYIRDITAAQLQHINTPVTESKDIINPDMTLLETRIGEIKAVLRECGKADIADSTDTAIAAFLSVLPEKPLLRLALTSVEQMPMSFLLPHADKDKDYEDSLDAFSDIAVRQLHEEAFSGIGASTWGAFLKVALTCDDSEEIFTTMLEVMPTTTYADNFASYVELTGKLND